MPQIIITESLPPGTYTLTPAGGSPPLPPPPVCPAGQHLENGVCVPDVVIPPPDGGPGDATWSYLPPWNNMSTEGLFPQATPGFMAVGMNGWSVRFQADPVKFPNGFQLGARDQNGGNMAQPKEFVISEKEHSFVPVPGYAGREFKMTEGGGIYCDWKDTGKPYIHVLKPGVWYYLNFRCVAPDAPWAANGGTAYAQLTIAPM